MTVKVNSRTQQEVGNKLREIRERKNLSQEEVADTIGISVTYYAGIERGEENPTMSVLEHICRSLRIRSSDFLPF